MVKQIKSNDSEDEIKKQLEELKAQLKTQTKKAKPKKAVKPVKAKPKKADKPQKEKPKKAANAEKEKAEKAAKAEQESEKIQKTPEEELEEQYSDDEIRNFQIEKKDMDRITNQVCEIVANFGDKGMLQSDLWKKLKLSNRDGSRLALRLERRGLISREKILQRDRWTYKLIIEQTPISLESLQNSPCLTCPVEQKCDIQNVHPEPSPLYCQLIEDWVIAEFSKKKK